MAVASPEFSTECLDLLAALVGFDTTSHKSNLEIIGFIETYLAANGVDSHRVTTADGTKASLFASIGPDSGGGVALSAHTDVVPVEGQTWSADPFTLRSENGRVYGRGTTDMKGFLACTLAVVPRYQRLAASGALRRPIHLAYSYDEEIGCIGVRPMIAEMGASLALPAMVIVGEPTGMRVVDAHKGPIRWRVTITGRAAHSSMAPLGVNAISTAAVLISKLHSIADDLKTSSQNDRFDPPYATLQVTRISGGTASNIIPNRCEFEFDVRAVPGVIAKDIEMQIATYAQTACLPQMRAVAPESDIVITRLNDVPPFSAESAPAAVQLALALTGDNATHAVSYATEAGLFQDAAMASVVCGPGHIDQAHTADEWIAESELNACLKFLERLGEWACQGETPNAA